MLSICENMGICDIVTDFSISANHLYYYLALYIWTSLCKTLPGTASFDKNADEYDTPTLSSWSSYMTDYHFLLKSSNNKVQILDQDAAVIEPLDVSTAPVLYALAVGGTGNEEAMCIYRSMMEYAQNRG